MDLLRLPWKSSNLPVRYVIPVNVGMIKVYGIVHDNLSLTREWSRQILLTSVQYQLCTAGKLYTTFLLYSTVIFLYCVQYYWIHHDESSQMKHLSSSLMMWYLDTNQYKPTTHVLYCIILHSVQYWVNEVRLKKHSQFCSCIYSTALTARFNNCCNIINFLNSFLIFSYYCITTGN